MWMHSLYLQLQLLVFFLLLSLIRVLSTLLFRASSSKYHIHLFYARSAEIAVCWIEDKRPKKREDATSTLQTMDGSMKRRALAFHTFKSPEWIDETIHLHQMNVSLIFLNILTRFNCFDRKAALLSSNRWISSFPPRSPESSGFSELVFISNTQKLSLIVAHLL